MQLGLTSAEIRGACRNAVEPVHAITTIVTVTALAASATAARLQISTHHIQSHNHIDSIIPQ